MVVECESTVLSIVVMFDLIADTSTFTAFRLSLVVTFANSSSMLARSVAWLSNSAV